MKNVNVNNYKGLQDALVDFIYTHEETVLKVENVKFKFYLKASNGLYEVKHGRKVNSFNSSWLLMDYIKEAVHEEKYGGKR